MSSKLRFLVIEVLPAFLAVGACGGEVAGGAASVGNGGTGGIGVPVAGHATGGRAIFASGGVAIIGLGGQFVSTGTGGATVCPYGQTLCGSSCTNLQSDDGNCGACGRTCQSIQFGGCSFCAQGQCQATPGMANCGGGACVHLQDDPINCGACGNVCLANQACIQGVCELVCSTGWADCGTGICMDLANNPNNCGACSLRCSAPEICASGVCTCPKGWLQCGTTCVDLQADVDNCGSCGNSCSQVSGWPTGEICSGGTCTCPPGLTLCGSLPGTNPPHFWCGSACPA